MSGSGSIIKAAPASISPRTISPQSSPRGRLSPQKSAPAPEQPSERPISEALRPLERRGQASEGGGWGWGSMWSSVSSYATTNQCNINPPPPLIIFCQICGTSHGERVRYE